MQCIQIDINTKNHYLDLDYFKLVSEMIINKSSSIKLNIFKSFLLFLKSTSTSSIKKSVKVNKFLVAKEFLKYFKEFKFLKYKFIFKFY